MEYTIDITRIFRKLVKKLWLILLVTVLSAGVGAAATFREMPDIYCATVTWGSFSKSFSDNDQNISLMKNYASLITSRAVAVDAQQQLTKYNLSTKTIQSMVKAVPNEKSASVLLDISAYSQDPQMAVDVVNAVAEAFARELNGLMDSTAVKIVDKAVSAPIYSSGHSRRMHIRLLSAGGGFLAACVVLGLMEVFSTKVSQIEDCQLGGKIKVLGVIPRNDIR